MKKRPVFFFFVFIFLVQTVAHSQVYDTIARKQTVIFDIGMGSMFLREIANDGGYSDGSSRLDQFSPKINFQTTLGYALKLDRMRLEWKVGYNHAQYYIDIEEYPGGKGPSASTTQTGNAILNAGFAQLLGLTFGKERSWGSLCIGFNLRYNFLIDNQGSGISITEGGYWNGSIVVPVYEEKPFDPPLYFSWASIGLQAGANFRINSQGEIQARIEYNINANNLNNYSAFQGLICVGYVIVLKRDRVVMRRN